LVYSNHITSLYKQIENGAPCVVGVQLIWLDDSPTATAKELMERLSVMLPDAYPSKAQLRTLQRRVKAWRAGKAKDLILGQLRRTLQTPAPVASN